MTLNATADDFLAQCTRCVVKGEAAPAWSEELNGVDAEVAVQGRIAFHGIALLLAEHPSVLDDWPEDLRTHTQSEARMQGIWEISHAQAVATLFEALHDAGVTAIAMKGTALAYSLYDDPAIRRRGDTDILIHTLDRDHARRVMREAGFSPGGDPLALQEEWYFHTGINFNHEIDVHWRINASQALSRALEHDPASQRAIDLPRLSKNAKGMGVLDSILHTCVNRAAHHAYGYPVNDEKLMEGDRFIWAIDLDKLASALSASDWNRLVEMCERSGLSGLVRDGLHFAQSKLETAIPAGVLDSLASHQSDQPAAHYFDVASGRKRLMLDLAACATFREKAQLIRHALLPGRDFFAHHIDDHARYSLATLRAKRLANGALKLIAGRS